MSNFIIAELFSVVCVERSNLILTNRHDTKNSRKIRWKRQYEEKKTKNKADSMKKSRKTTRKKRRGERETLPSRRARNLSKFVCLLHSPEDNGAREASKNLFFTNRNISLMSLSLSLFICEVSWWISVEEHERKKAKFAGIRRKRILEASYWSRQPTCLGSDLLHRTWEGEIRDAPPRLLIDILLGEYLL